MFRLFVAKLQSRLGSFVTKLPELALRVPQPAKQMKILRPRSCQELGNFIAKYDLDGVAFSDSSAWTAHTYQT